ncbi:MAG: hypothetical protein IAG13_08230 [Deltaproteobacteria bacterium]|nr:hypothetical protein [Nannocystaceae bacterium]
MLALACAVSSGCAAEGESICQEVGRAGALLTSIDNVLSIAISPEALDESVEVCIAQSREAPEVAGPAYRVKPSLALNYAATVTYRHALPSDTSEINIGRIDGEAFAAGDGSWASMDDCRVQASDRLVRCSDTELAAYYGLLDGLQGNTADSIADTAGETGASAETGTATTPMTTTPMTTTPMTTVDPTDDETIGEETDPTDPTGGIEYPPECDDLVMGPFTDMVVDHGPLFESVDALPPLGPEDLAMDGNGGLVARSGTTLRRYVLGDPLVLDDSFAPPTNLNTPTLGLRYTPGGDLVMMQRSVGRIEVMSPDYSIETLLMQSATSIPNGLYIDPAGVLWVTFYGQQRISRYDPAAKDPEFEQVAMQMEPNGVLFDPLRQVVFYLNYGGQSPPGQVLRMPIDPDGTSAGAGEVVTDLDDAFADGLGLDVCGNVYVVDQGGATDLFAANTSRVFRVFMDDDGELEDLEVIIEIEEDDDGNGAEVSNIAWGDGEFSTTAYLVGLRGRVYSVDLQIGGAPQGAHAP